MMKMCARKYYASAICLILPVVIFTIIFLLLASPSFGAGNSVAFRPVLTEDDLDGKTFDSLAYGEDSVYIWHLRYLADRDIKKADIFRSATNANRLLVGFTVNEDGAKRLGYFTRKWGMRRLVVFADGRLIGMIAAVPPTFIGERIVVKWPGTEAELRAFATRVNKAPPGMMTLYMDEVGRYNDVAADAWASAYIGLNKYIEDKRREAKVSKALADQMEE